MRFAAANCQAFHDGFYAAHRGIARENVDFVVHLGDYIYEHGQEGGVPAEHVRDHEGPEIFTIADYRRRHALYKGDRSLREAHAAHPWFLTWDDHEVANDYSSAGGDAPFMQRRAAAYQAWYENMPHRDAGNSALPDPEIHRVRRWGNLLELTVLDLRSYRSERNLADGTILGAGQKAWLKQGVDRAPDTWHVWANSIMLSQLRGRPGGSYMFTDQWDGYLAERKEVLNHVHSSGMEDFVVITGDWHSAFVDDVRLDFDDTVLAGDRYGVHRPLRHLGRVLPGLERGQRPAHGRGESPSEVLRGQPLRLRRLRGHPEALQHPYAGHRRPPRPGLAGHDADHVPRGPWEGRFVRRPGHEELARSVAQGLLTQAADCTGARL